MWLDAIDFSKLAIAGGCVLNALRLSPFVDTKEQDVNLIYCGNDSFDFERTINVTVKNLKKISKLDSMNHIEIEQIPGAPRYNVLLPCHVRLNFIWTPIHNSEKPLSHILHNFDMDICQVAFTGISRHILIDSSVLIILVDF